MRDAEVAVLVDRIVASAHVPRRRARAELRRELVAHFEDAQAAGADPADAVRRFGAERDVVSAFRRIYAVEYALLYALKVCASMAASLAAALAIEMALTVRVAPRGLFFAVAVVVTVVVAWELARPPRSAVRAALARTPLLVIFATFAAVQYASHAAIGIWFPPARAIVAGGIPTAVAIVTLAILAQFDRTLTHYLESE